MESLASAINTAEVRGLSTFHGFLYLFSDAFFFDFSDLFFTFVVNKSTIKWISESKFWQGTIVYLQLQTNKEINPTEVVANRTNVAAQYNETFLNDKELDALW